MKIAVEGCCHGQLDFIYDTLQKIQDKEQIKIDLLLCCGDFQAVRNSEDLNSLAVPDKYKEMGSFYKYYSGEAIAPFLTIFIGGNHEASNHLRELAYGGWVAPNIYYIGHAGVIKYGGLRIGGISGIYKVYDYNKGHYEVPPYTHDTLRSTYHIRECDVFRLKQLTGNIDIMMSHDWPMGIHLHGNYHKLYQYKPHLQNDGDDLGSPPAMELLQYLKPSFWFSAHLHCKFAAVYRHTNNDVTKFLALDKCLPRKRFLQVINVPSGPDPQVLEYDKEWLSIIIATEPYMVYSRSIWMKPELSLPANDVSALLLKFMDDFKIPFNFEPNTDCHAKSTEIDLKKTGKARENPQTKIFCEKLGIVNPWCDPTVLFNPDKIKQNVSGSEDNNHSYRPDDMVIKIPSNQLTPTLAAVSNPDEICLDDKEDEET